MTRRWPRISLPLLARELTEQAARRRTYVIRVAYACLLFGGVGLFSLDLLQQIAANPVSALGRGGLLFSHILQFESIGILLFMPALTCGTITSEKERNTLGDLLITRLSPFTIVLEKFLSRLVPMFSFLLLSLPLMGFAYTLGGVTQTTLWVSITRLALIGIQIAAIGVMCSAFCRTTVAAFISTYLLEATMLFCVRPFGTFALTSASAFAGVALPANPLAIRWLVIIILCGGSLMFTVTCLLLARWFLVSRAFVRPRNRLLQLFRALDGMFQRMNRVTGNVVLVRDDQTLPDERPIAWREMYKRSLGTARYLFRVLTVIELPVLMVLVLSAGLSIGRPNSPSSVMLYLVWIVALLLVTVTAVTAVGGERSSQTLPVLLATPLSGREILEQKMSGVYRLMVVLAVPFLTIFGFETYWQATLNTDIAGLAGGRDGDTFPFLPLIAGVISVAVYLPLTAWFAMLVGLKMKSQARALMTTLTVVTVWVALPLLLAVWLELRGVGSHPIIETWKGVAMLSGSGLVVLNQARELTRHVLIANVLIYGGLFVVLRLYAFRQADRLLGRGESRSSGLSSEKGLT